MPKNAAAPTAAAGGPATLPERGDPSDAVQLVLVSAFIISLPTPIANQHLQMCRTPPASLISIGFTTALLSGSCWCLLHTSPRCPPQHTNPLDSSPARSAPPSTLPPSRQSSWHSCGWAVSSECPDTATWAFAADRSAQRAQRSAVSC